MVVAEIHDLNARVSFERAHVNVLQVVTAADVDLTCKKNSSGHSNDFEVSRHLCRHIFAWANLSCENKIGANLEPFLSWLCHERAIRRWSNPW